ncbi:uncharacterized protein V1513DRAFT_446640 [Lipomyces chichibuensis]|uniref:uncharacterized protein n=1 Tax=Lipomyces chichibuensis TaxID=1546026 RepID=UPI00334332E1
MAADSVSCVEPVLYNPCTPYFDFSKNEYVVELAETRHPGTKRKDATVDNVEARETPTTSVVGNNKKEGDLEYIVSKTKWQKIEMIEEGVQNVADELDNYENKYSDRSIGSEGPVQPDGILWLDEAVLSEYTAYEKLSRYYDLTTHWQQRNRRIGCGYTNTASVVHSVNGNKATKLVQVADLAIADADVGTSNNARKIARVLC